MVCLGDVRENTVYKGDKDNNNNNKYVVIVIFIVNVVVVIFIVVVVNVFVVTYLPGVLLLQI